MTNVVRPKAADSRAVLLVLVIASLVCAPVSWIVDGLTPSMIVYPLVLFGGLWRMWRGHGTLYFGIAATVFLLVHIPFTWAALFGHQNPTGANNPYNPTEWVIVLFTVPLLTAISGFVAWRNAQPGSTSERQVTAGQ